MNQAPTEDPDLLRRVFALTPAGRNELQNPQSGLSLPQRWLLGRLDGKSDLAELSSLPGSPAPDRLPRAAAKLVSLGLALSVGEPGPAESAFGPSTPFDAVESRPPPGALPPRPAPSWPGPGPSAPQGTRRPVVAAGAALALVVALGVGYYSLGDADEVAVASAAAGAATGAAVAPPSTALSAATVATAPEASPALQPAAAPQVDGPQLAASARPVAADAAPVRPADNSPAASTVAAVVPAAARPAASAPAPAASAPAPVPVPVASRPVPGATSLALVSTAAAPAPGFATPAPAEAAAPPALAPAANVQPALPADTAPTVSVPSPASTEAGRATPAALPPLRPLTVVEPEFPRAGLGVGPQGVVVEARLVVAANGSVTQVSFPQSRSSTRPFERAARQALMQWRFPAGPGERVIVQSLSFREE